MVKLAIFGGSFNPPHYGHIDTTFKVLQRFNLDEIWVMPCPDFHPFHKQLIEFKYRYQLCELAWKNKSKQIHVSDLHNQINSPYIVDLIDFIKNKYDCSEISIIIGSDCLPNLYKWNNFNRLSYLVKFIVIPREESDVSSTKIRNMIKNKQIFDSKIFGVNYNLISEFIANNKLYL